MRELRKSIIVVNIIIMLVALSWLPLVSGNSISSTSEVILVNEKNKLSSSGGIFDELLIRCHGSYLMELLMIPFGDPVFLFETRLTNFHDEDITIKQHISLVGKRDNRVLDEFDDDLPFKLKSGHICITKYFTQFDWKNYDYRFGRFDFIWDIYIPEADSSIKLVFHGFVFFFGTIVFNPEGEVI